MKNTDNYKEFTNAELNLKLKSLENQYEANKKKVLDLINEMHELDVNYQKVKAELKNRSMGLW
jgi:t-SNARE complex subunit (syntaxin)